MATVDKMLDMIKKSTISIPIDSKTLADMKATLEKKDRRKNDRRQRPPANQSRVQKTTKIG